HGIMYGSSEIEPSLLELVARFVLRCHAPSSFGGVCLKASRRNSRAIFPRLCHGIGTRGYRLESFGLPTVMNALRGDPDAIVRRIEDEGEEWTSRSGPTPSGPLYSRNGSGLEEEVDRHLALKLPHNLH